MREAFRLSIWALLLLIGTGLLALALVGIPRLLSDDPCLRDAGVDCTTAGATLQALDIAGTLAGLVAVRALPIIAVIAIVSEATQYGSDRRRRRRTQRARSAGRGAQQPTRERRRPRGPRPFGL
jgi:hypothetical protein